MAAKQLLYEEDARKKIHAGVHKLVAAVKSTLGPAGRAVILNKSFGGPQVTNDGVTVSKEIELPDPFENMGAKLVNEVASKTNDVSGDGTTTACVLAEAILDEGMKVVAAGVNPIELKRGIEKCVDAAVAALKDLSKPVETNEQIEQVGTISANHDETIGRVFAEAMEKVGKEGVIVVEEGKTRETELEHVGGYQFDKGYLSPYLITNATEMSVEFDNPYILCFEKKIGGVRELLPLLDKVVAQGASLLIVAEDVEGKALSTLVLNKLQGVLKVAAVKAPGFGDRRKAMLEDMAVLTGGTFVSEELGLELEKLELEHLGRAQTVTITKDTTTIIEGGGADEDVSRRAEQIRRQIEQTTSNYDREKLEERLAKLTGGVAIVRVGGNTEVEVKETKMRVDDALHATKAAVEEGIVPGGGAALLRTLPAIDAVELTGDESFGRRIVKAAAKSPCRQIADNAGYDGAVVVEDVIEAGGSNGFDARVGAMCDLSAVGIIDPTKVVRSALQHAASVAGLILTTNTMITEIKDDQEVAGAVR